MTLLETIKALEGLASNQPSVNMIVQNDIFRLNTIPDAKYGVFGWVQQQHSVNDDVQVFSFALFYVDRLTEDKGNEIEIQSVGVNTLENIIKGMENLGLFPVSEWQISAFNQRFMDECAGVWASVRIAVPVNYTCEDNYSNKSVRIV